jgi:hypothetical protein
VFNILTAGTTAVPPLSAPVANFLQPLLFTFSLVDVKPITSSPNAQVTYNLVQVITIPEPASIGLGGLGLAFIAITARRSRRPAIC